MAISLHDLSLCLYRGGCPCEPPSVPADLLDVPADIKTPAAVFEHVKGLALAQIPTNIGRPFRVTRLAHVWAAMATRHLAEQGRYTLAAAEPYLTHLDDALHKGDAVANLIRLCPDLRPITVARVVGTEPMTVQRAIRKLDSGSAT